MLGIAWRGGPWRRQLAWGAGLAIGLVGAVAIVNRVTEAFPYSFPPSFYAYAALVIFAATVAVVGSRALGPWRRVDSLVAVVLCGALVGVVVNARYDYHPQLANLFGRVSANEVGLAGVAGIRDRTEASGQLPEKGSVVHLEIPGTRSGFHAREGYVYLPPAYLADPQPKLPVLMLIHGVPGAPSDWMVGGQAGDVLDDFAASHGGRRPIVVMPDATGGELDDTECVDGGHGQAYTYLTTDVPATIEATFTTATGNGTWGVAGLSTGGFCSSMIPLRDPDRFAVFGDYSGLDQPELDPPESALADSSTGISS